MTLTQTGDDNFIGLYKHTYGPDTQTSSTMTGTQTGDDNIMRLDNMAITTTSSRTIHMDQQWILKLITTTMMWLLNNTVRSI